MIENKISWKENVEDEQKFKVMDLKWSWSPSALLSIFSLIQIMTNDCLRSPYANFSLKNHKVDLGYDVSNFEPSFWSLYLRIRQ